MTQPKERDTDTLYVTDAELIRRLGVPEEIARSRLLALDADPRSGYPPKQKLWGNRRYWPAVIAWHDAYSGLTLAPSSQPKEAARDRKYA